MRAALWISLLLIAPVLAAADNAAPRELANTLPRHFGYLIGERFTQRVRIAAPAAYRLEETTLPKLGRANRWLELQAIDTRRRAANDAAVHELAFTYQVMTSDDTLSLAPLPRPALGFTNGAQRINLRVSGQHISVSPLSEFETWEHTGLQALRPERGTPLANALATQQRMAGYVLALLAIALYWLYRIYGLPFLARDRGPFFRAWRGLRKLRGADGAALTQALRGVHRAFDATYGRTVFHHEVDGFLAAHPRYAPLREPIHAFFALSRQSFYAGIDADAVQLSELRALVHRLSRVERGLA